MVKTVHRIGKTLSIAMVMLILSLTLCTPVTCSADWYALSNTEWATTELVPYIFVTEPPVVPQDLRSNITFIGTASYTEQARIYQVWNSLPESVRQQLIHRDMEIVLVNAQTENINTLCPSIDPSINALGAYSQGGRTVVETDDGWRVQSFHNRPRIYIQVGNLSDPAITLCHEIGHCVSDCNDDPRQQLSLAYTDEFCLLHDTYHATIATYDSTANANTYSPAETFAEAFRILMLDPSWLAVHCPDMFWYMSRATTTFESFEYQMI